MFRFRHLNQFGFVLLIVIVSFSFSFFLLSFSIKSGKVVILTAGRFAGKKAVVVKTSEEGNQSKKFGHALGKLGIILV